MAAIEAGFVRLRPVIMTALAMIIGMLPMALGFGEGGEQNAPLGRAVVGGLCFATVATLIFVPVVFSIIQPAPRFGGRPRNRRAPACRLIHHRPAYRAAAFISPACRSPSLPSWSCVFGITTRKVADAKLREWTENQAVPVVAVAPPDTRGKMTTFSLPGPTGGLYAGANLRAGHRLRERLEGRHRHSGKIRPAARRTSTRPISTSRSCRRKPTWRAPRPTRRYRI